MSTLAGIGVLGVAATAYVALRTSPGLSLDERVLNAVSTTALAQDQLHKELRSVTHVLIALLLLALAVLALSALVRLRFDLAVGAVIVVGGANLTTHYLQHDVFTRRDLSLEANGLPSQHETVALSIALAAVIVAPSAWRPLLAIGMSAATTMVGVALILGRWHRPSDVLAATFVCLVWAAVGLLAARLVGRHPAGSAGSARGVGTPVAALISTWTVSVVLVCWGARLQPGLADLGLAAISLGTIGPACVLSVAAVAHVTNHHLTWSARSD